MQVGFKQVPALVKCFHILELLAKSKNSLGISDIARAFDYNRSTVFNMIHTLVDLGILEKRNTNKFHLGNQLFVLSRSAMRHSELVNTVRPYLEKIARKTRLMTFFGIRSGMRAVILDRIDSTFDIKVMAEVGMRIPLLAGAGGKALLTQLSDADIDKILGREKLEPFTPFSCTDLQRYKAMVQETRRTGIAYDNEEYIQGIRALAVPLKLNRPNFISAIWTVGLKDQIQDDQIDAYVAFLKEVAQEIETRCARI